MGAFVPVGGSLLQKKLLDVAMNAATSLDQLLHLGTLGITKSPDQIAAEYTISRITNDVERAMDINRWAFWSGLISQEDALQNYAYLWHILVVTSQQYAQISAAQAARLLSDRDCGGQFGNLWRGVFRDEIVNAPLDHLQNGYVVPEWQWDWGAEKLKYGDAPSEIRTPNPLPTPGQIATFEGTGAGQGIASSGAFSLLKWAGLGWLAWKLIWKLIR